MANTETHYETLGVARSAKSPDIVRAYKRIKSQLQADDVAPDPARMGRVEEAFAVLNDEPRRIAYDTALAGTTRKRWGKKTIVWVATIVAGVAGIVVYVVEQRMQPPPVVGGASAQDVLDAATIAVGRLQAIDMSGNATPLGVASVVAENVMVAPCRGISPTTQLTVTIPPRTLPARVASVDETLGLCRLTAQGTGTRPLPLAGGEPKSGEKLFAANVGGTGKIALAEGYVRKVDSDERLIDATFRESAVASGSPLIDAYGRVVGLAFVPAADGKLRHVQLPKAWVRDINDPRPPEQKTNMSDDIPQKAPEQSLETQAPGIKLSPEHQKRLEKTYRPPPQVPDDL